MELLSLLTPGPTGWGDELLIGLGMTLGLALATFPVSIMLSFLIHRARNSRRRLVRYLAQMHVSVFKSLPEILTLLIIYYQSQVVISWGAATAGIDSTLSISPFLAGLIALSLVISAYRSEVVRGALQAIGKGQVEAAQALGLSGFHCFWKVILPQFWRHALPGLGNLWVILLKDTSLVSVIALSDLTHVAALAINTTREPFFFYLVIAAIYISLVILSSWIQKRLERRATRGVVAGGRAHA